MDDRTHQLESAPLLVPARGATPEHRCASAPKNGAWIPKFLTALAQCGRVNEACAIAGVSDTAAYKHRKRDPEFRQQWNEARREAVEYLLDVAITFGTEGIPKPIVYQGEVTAWVREPSPSILTRLLQAFHPDFNEVQRVELSGPGGEPVRLTVAEMSDDELDAEIKRLGGPVLEVING